MVNGNKPLKKKRKSSTSQTLRCVCCDAELKEKEFYSSNSDIFASYGKIPYCKECIVKITQKYYEKYVNLEYANPDRKAVERVCMLLDVYYTDEVFDSVRKQSENGKMSSTPLILLYMKQIKMAQYKGKNYDTTIHDKYKIAKKNDSVFSIYNDDDSQKSEEVSLGEKLFGSGFSSDDYAFLYKEYCDWTTRHECQTKSQEELFKQICHAQLNLFKAEKNGGDVREIKDLSQTFQNLLDSANLKPKQNAGNTISDAQTFGTLIDKWENTRPIPEVDDELKDVDKIGLYIDVFFRGHLSKMMGLKNSLSDLYDKFIGKYTVEKTEYDADDNDDALFEAIFGKNLEDEVLNDDKEN